MVLYFLGQFRVGAVYTVGIGKRGTFFFFTSCFCHAAYGRRCKDRKKERKVGKQKKVGKQERGKGYNTDR